MTRGKRRKAGIQSMENVATWEGIPVKGVPGGNPPSGNIPHVQNIARYDENGDLKFYGKLPGMPDPPVELQADGYAAFVPQQPLDTRTPQGHFDSSGICDTTGWVQGVWYTVGDRGEHPSNPGGPAASAAQARLNAAAIAFSLASK